MRKSRLVVVCTLITAFGCSDSESRQQSRAVAEWALGIGATLTVSVKTVPVKTVGELPPDSFELERLVLNETDVADDDLQKLSGLNSLGYLGLYRCNITDKGLEHLVGIRSLTELELSYTQIGDEGLGKLKELSNLQKLFLYGTLVSDEAVESLQKQLSDCTIYR